MSNGDSWAVDAILKFGATSFIEAQSTEHQEQIWRGISALMAYPYEDGRTRVRIGFPFRYDSICYATADFLIAYYFENAAVVAVYAVVPRMNPQR